MPCQQKLFQLHFLRRQFVIQDSGKCQLLCSTHKHLMFMLIIKPHRPWEGMKVKGIGEFCGYLVSHKGNHKFCDHQRVSEQDFSSRPVCPQLWLWLVSKTKLAPNLSLYLLPPYPCQLYSGGNFPTKLILWKRKKHYFMLWNIMCKQLNRSTLHVSLILLSVIIWACSRITRIFHVIYIDYPTYTCLKAINVT